MSTEPVQRIRIHRFNDRVAIHFKIGQDTVYIDAGTLPAFIRELKRFRKNIEENTYKWLTTRIIEQDGTVYNESDGKRRPHTI